MIAARSGSCSKPMPFAMQWHTCLNLVGLNKALLLNIKKRFAEVVTVPQITSFEAGGETSKEVAKRPGIEKSKGAKCPGSEPSR